MPKKPSPSAPRDTALSRERIVDAAIALLDASGEAGLTFRALAGKLSTGPGAIYWHVDNKGDLFTAACDALVARTLEKARSGKAPEASLRALALGMFDTIDDHPWVGSALTRAPGQLPAVRLMERIGQCVQALGVPAKAQWATAMALLSYILGVAGQNAANRTIAVARGIDREQFLGAVADEWLALDAEAYPFTRGVAACLPHHDDRKDFLAGIDLILRGIGG